MVGEKPGEDKSEGSVWKVATSALGAVVVALIGAWALVEVPKQTEAAAVRVQLDSAREELRSSKNAVEKLTAELAKLKEEKTTSDTKLWEIEAKLARANERIPVKFSAAISEYDEYRITIRLKIQNDRSEDAALFMSGINLQTDDGRRIQPYSTAELSYICDYAASECLKSAHLKPLIVQAGTVNWAEIKFSQYRSDQKKPAGGKLIATIKFTDNLQTNIEEVFPGR